MTVILPSVLLFVLCIILFIREVKLDREGFLEKDRLADEHILREVERFIKEMEQKACGDSTSHLPQKCGNKLK